MSPGRFPDLGDLRIKACLAAPRSFSQLNHVLRRLWTPRHPPCTLRSLTTLFLVHRGCHIANQSTLFSKNAPPAVPVRLLVDQFGPCAVRPSPRAGWRRPDSNRRPPGCKPGALPAELRPPGAVVRLPSQDRTNADVASDCEQRRDEVVGLSGFEPLTSRLSGGRSNQLSYKPGLRGASGLNAKTREPRTVPPNWCSKKRVTLVFVRSTPMLATSPR